MQSNALRLMKIVYDLTLSYLPRYSSSLFNVGIFSLEEPPSSMTTQNFSANFNPSDVLVPADSNSSITERVT